MDITPELIAEIDFPDALKGFDKDAVDDFLGQVGTELGRVRYELRKAERRVAELEEDATRASLGAGAGIQGIGCGEGDPHDHGRRGNRRPDRVGRHRSGREDADGGQDRGRYCG